MWTSTRRGSAGPAHVDACGQRGKGGQKPDFFCVHHKWMTPWRPTASLVSVLRTLSNFSPLPLLIQARSSRCASQRPTRSSENEHFPPDNSTCIHIYIRAFTPVHIDVSTHVYTHAIHTCIRTYVHAYIHTMTFIYIYIY